MCGAVSVPVDRRAKANTENSYKSIECIYDMRSDKVHRYRWQPQRIRWIIFIGVCGLHKERSRRVEWIERRQNSLNFNVVEMQNDSWNERKTHIVVDSAFADLLEPFCHWPESQLKTFNERIMKQTNKLRSHVISLRKNVTSARCLNWAKSLLKLVWLVVTWLFLPLNVYANLSVRLKWFFFGGTWDNYSELILSYT